MAPGEGGYRQINKALDLCVFEDYLKAQQKRMSKLLDVEQVSPRVIRILGQNPGKFTLQGTNTYIIGTGAKRLIIDTGQGIPAWAGLIAETLATKDFSVSNVLLTHWHGDHTGGVPHLIQLYPELSDFIFKHTPSKTQQPIFDGQTFTVEGATVRAIHTPGHSNDHMCFILEEENAMFTGDNVLGQGTTAVEHLGTWMDTLRIMQSHNCIKGYPAHGDVIPNLHSKIAGELAGKLRRERQVLRALHQIQTGLRGRRLSTKEVVVAVHGEKISEHLMQRALEPLMDEILRKLAEDGMVGFDMRGGVKRWFAVT
ncbi:hypothetical protein N7508_008065 [Penicillium antarcticum]|uniref:uncharacterized protein n=1 Tax=Penicillium antarcticum TaxID=416450 RepID=UPI002393C976|nr:uncharacterized protein N7508_008065 [Penicillium antarcticum]KAJ5297816.1 hypothetical protein N7508_008065 [Penicillium antarcticum]